MIVIIAAVFSSSGRYGEKSADQEALEEQKADLQANLREIDRKLADEQKKMENIRAASRMHPGSGRW